MHTCVHIYIRTYIHNIVYIYIYQYISMYVCIYIYTCMCMRTYACMYVHYWYIHYIMLRYVTLSHITLHYVTYILLRTTITTILYVRIYKYIQIICRMHPSSPDNGQVCAVIYFSGTSEKCGWRLDSAACPSDLWRGQ